MLPYVEGILVSISIFAVLAVSLDLLIGYTGQFTIAQGALFGVGAYASALTAGPLGFWSGLPAGAAAGAALGGLVALPALRVSGDYLILASFAVQVAVSGLFLNLEATGGPGGLSRIPRPSIFGTAIDDPGAYLALYACIGLALVLLARRVVGSPFGLVLASVREDELLAQTLGKSVARTKVKVFLLSGALAGAAGSLYAHYVTFIDPGSFDVEASIFVLSTVLVGGMGSIWGPVFGSALLIALPEALRFLPVAAGAAGPVRQIAYGAVLIAFCFLRPSGRAGVRR